MSKPKGAVTDRIVALRTEINRHNHSYYVLDKPSISDRDFDRLLQELIDLETAHPELITPESPTQRVGGDVQTELRSVEHAVPMMSIDNTYNEGEVRAFDTRVRKALDGDSPDYVLEPKIDGTSVNLRYERGVLVLAATRGRGNLGEDITVNVRTIKSIPLELHQAGDVKPPPILEVRGEIYMDNEDFQRVNKEIVAEGDEPYQNPRNLTSGTVRRLDPKIVAKRRLRFLAHGLGEVKPMPTDNYWDWTKLLKKWGLPLPAEVTRAKSIEQVLEQIHKFADVRPSLPYMTDGIVIKVNSFDQRDQLGATSKSPRWVIAYKYESEQQPTILRGVRWQVGKGGNLTPVGDLEPVFIGGVTVTHVSLHNIDQIRRLDIHLGENGGDTLIIERSGEVIPYVVQVDATKRPRGAKPIEPPTKCPSCGTPVEKEADTPYIRCVNPDCKAKLKERLRWFCGRSQMDIEGLGEKLIDQLVDRALVKSFGELFALTVDQIAGLTHETEIGEKTATKIVQAIQSTTAPAALTIPGSLKDQIAFLADKKQMNIPGLGDRTIEQLVDNGFVKSSKDLPKLTVAQLAGLSREVKVGETSAKKIVANIDKARERGLARVLAGIGIRHVGTTVARDLAVWAGDIETLQQATIQQLRQAISGTSEPDDQDQKMRDLASLLHKALHGSDLFAAHGKSTTEYLQQHVKDFGLASRIREKRIAQLADQFPNVPELLDASEDELFDAMAERKVIGESVHEFLQSAEGKKIIHDLQKAGVRLTEAKPRVQTNSEFTGKTIVITGTFPISRDVITEKLLAMGASVSGSVSKKTSIVFAGEEAGSKLTKAQELGVEIWDIPRVMKAIST